MLDTFKAGQVTVGTSAAQLSGIPRNLNGVVLKAMNANVGKIFIGQDNTVSPTTGFELGPGEGMPLELVNPSKLWAISDTAAQKICWASVSA